MGSNLRSLLRPPIQVVRSLRDRALHPFRRRQARAIVRSIAPPSSVLFICSGNICRSPYAEKVFRAGLDRSSSAVVDVFSAGFLEPSRPSPEAAIDVAARRGVRLKGHRSRQVDRESLARADLVVVTDSGHRRGIRELAAGGEVPILLLGDLDPTSPISRSIPDPWGHPDTVFQACFERIERCISALVLLAFPKNPKPPRSEEP